MLLALKSNKEPTFKSEDEELSKFLQHKWQKEIILDVPVLTDDYAPVDFYTIKIIK